MELDETPNVPDLPLQPVTLLFLVRSGEVLLAMKKRGFGQGKWNGVGGKVEPGETPSRAAVREAQEEIGVEVDTVVEMATLTFIFEGDTPPEWNMLAHVFRTERWRGEPTETEEMRPRWFPTDALPFDAMWADDRFWLPRVLRGEQLEGVIFFTPEGEVTRFSLTRWEGVQSPR
jgi:8-oxo-dGTP pyrophosphatase MutT (NUDIX family)